MVISYQNLMIFPSKTVTNWVSSIRARGTWSGSLVVALRRNWSDGIRQLWTAHPPATPSMNLWRNDIDSVYIDYINIHIHIYMYKYIYICVCIIIYHYISLYIRVISAWHSHDILINWEKNWGVQENRMWMFVTWDQNLNSCVDLAGLVWHFRGKHMVDRIKIFAWGHTPLLDRAISSRVWYILRRTCPASRNDHPKSGCTSEDPCPTHCQTLPWCNTK